MATGAHILLLGSYRFLVRRCRARERAMPFAVRFGIARLGPAPEIAVWARGPVNDRLFMRPILVDPIVAFHADRFSLFT